MADFNNEAVIKTEVNHDNKSLCSISTPEIYQDIREYFARPRLYERFDASTSPGSLLRAYNVTNPLVNFWPVTAQNRFNGVFGYRCTLRVTVTVAATPFQQGMVSIASQYGASTGTQFTQPKTTFVPMQTNLPHVRLDFSNSTMAQLDIPFQSMFDFFELANSSGSNGDNLTNNLTTYLILISQQLPTISLAGSSDPTLSVYFSMHDIELFGAVPVTSSNVLLQAGSDPTRTMNSESQNVSAALSHVSDAADSLSKIHILRPVSQPVGWLSRALSKTAASMGFSKPIDEGQISRVFASQNVGDSNVDMPDESLVVGPFASNRLQLDAKQSNSTVDEMDIDWVLSQYCQCFRGDVSTADAAGVVLYGANVCPTSFWFRTNTGRPGGNLPMFTNASLTSNCVMPTTLCYLGQAFQLWRGPIKFRFTFAKTRFHAGRLLVSYIPVTKDVFRSDSSLSDSVTTPEISAGLVQPFQHSQIFDLKDDYVFEFEVPYISSRPFMSTLGYSGSITMSVLDPLITTSTTATDINYIVEVAGAPGFELANYIGSGIAPFCGSNILGSTAILQSGSKVKEISQYTTGEKITSLKQLIMIPSWTVDTVNSFSNRSTYLWQWCTSGAFTLAIPMAANAQAGACLSNGNFIARMYAFGNGGTTYHVYSGRNNISVQVNQVRGTNGVRAFGWENSRFGTNATPPRVFTSGLVSSSHFKTPAYSRTHSPWLENFGIRSTQPSFGNTNGIPGSYASSCMYSLSVGNKTADNIDYMFGWGASDDARCWGYIGPPACALFTSPRDVPIDSLLGGF